MKYISFLFLLTSITLFTGCAGNSPEPFKTVPTKVGTNYVSSEENSPKTETLWLKVYGNVGSASDLENTAVVLVEAAKLFKSKNLKYFRFTTAKATKLPLMVDNMSDLIRYCYPSTENLSSLEDKCSLVNANGNVRYSISGSKDPFLEKFTWSVEQVLNDPVVKKYYDSALKDFEDKTISYKTVSSKKMYKYILSE